MIPSPPNPAFSSSNDAAAASGRYGVAIVGNDKIIDWLLPFLESYRATNSALPLYLIPYDDNIAQTRRAAEIYGAHFVEEEPTEIDRLDVILFQDFTSIFGRLKAAETEFIVASPSFEYVYNDRRAAYPFLDNVLLFNDGFWVTSNKYLKLSDFLDTMARDAAIFHDVRKRGQLFAQPLVNFVTHRRGLKIALLPDVVAKASHESFYKAPGVTFANGKPLAPDGKEIYFAHWAGATALPSRGVFDSAWTEYSGAAWARFKK